MFNCLWFVACRYYLLPTTQNVRSYWRKSNVHTVHLTLRTYSTHLRKGKHLKEN